MPGNYAYYSNTPVVAIDSCRFFPPWRALIMLQKMKSKKRRKTYQPLSSPRSTMLDRKAKLLRKKWEDKNASSERAYDYARKRFTPFQGYTHKQAKVMEEQAEMGTCTGWQGQQMPKGTCPKMYPLLPPSKPSCVCGWEAGKIFSCCCILCSHFFLLCHEKEMTSQF